MRFTAIFNSLVFSFAALMLAHGVLVRLGTPVGSFSDWLCGLLATGWLLAIVTVPWDVYFKAKAVLADAGPTRERGLAVDDRQVGYVRRVAAAALGAAVGLHVASAGVLFVLGRTGWLSPGVGYTAGALALLLTALRPAASAYQYLAERLRTIGQQWKYPQEDVVELRTRLDAAELAAKRFEAELDVDRPESLVRLQRDEATAGRAAVADVAAALNALRAANEADHDRLAREARSAVSQLSADGQFLDHARELIRFFKSA